MSREVECEFYASHRHTPGESIVAEVMAHSIAEGRWLVREEMRDWEAC
jgi:hypothetical protein